MLLSVIAITKRIHFDSNFCYHEANVFLFKYLLLRNNTLIHIASIMREFHSNLKGFHLKAKPFWSENLLSRSKFILIWETGIRKNFIFSRIAAFRENLILIRIAAFRKNPILIRIAAIRKQSNFYLWGGYQEDFHF